MRTSKSLVGGVITTLLAAALAACGSDDTTGTTGAGGSGTGGAATGAGGTAAGTGGATTGTGGADTTSSSGTGGGMMGCDPAACVSCNDVLVDGCTDFGQNGEKACPGSLILLQGIGVCACPDGMGKCTAECADTACAGKGMSAACSACIQASCANEYQACIDDE